MILFFLVRVLVPCMFCCVLQSMDEVGRAQKALALWRTNKFHAFTIALPSFPLQRSNPFDTLVSAQKSVHPFSFFCERNKLFYIKRLWSYSFYQENGCEYFSDCEQAQYDCIHYKTGAITHDGVLYTTTQDSSDEDSKGVCFLDRNAVEVIKKSIIELIASYMPLHKEAFKLENVRFSDDFLYVLGVVLAEEDNVIIVTPGRPCIYDYFAKDCFIDFK